MDVFKLGLQGMPWGEFAKSVGRAALTGAFVAAVPIVGTDWVSAVNVIHTHANDYAWWHKTLLVVGGAAAAAAWKTAYTFVFNQGHPASLAPKNWTVVRDDSPGLDHSYPAEYLSGDGVERPPAASDSAPDPEPETKA